MPENETDVDLSESEVDVRVPLDGEDWEIALQPYKGNPSAALSLGFRLIVLRSYLSVEPLKIQEAIAAIDLAVEVLFPHTQFHDLSLDFFRKVIEGKVTFEEEQKLKALGVNF